MSVIFSNGSKSNRKSIIIKPGFQFFSTLIKLIVLGFTPYRQYDSRVTVDLQTKNGEMYQCAIAKKIGYTRFYILS